MRKKELHMITDVLKGIKPAGSYYDWYSVTGALTLHKICGSFYRGALSAGLDMPFPVTKFLEKQLSAQRALSAAMKVWIDRISSALICSGIDHAFLKGSVLSHANVSLYDIDYSLYERSPHTLLRFSCMRQETFYEEGERISNDIDILIRPSDISAVTRALKELGFRQGYWDGRAERFVELAREEIVKRRMNRGETALFVLVTDSGVLPYIEVDVNFSVDYLPAGNEALLNRMLESAVRYEDACGNPLTGLAPELFLLHLLLHQYKEETVYSMVLRGKDLELYKYLDIYRFLHGKRIDPQKFTALVREFGLEDVAFPVIRQTGQLFRFSEADGLLAAIRPAAGEKDVSVFDPERGGRRYVWEKPFLERALYANRTTLLREERT